MTAVLRGIGRAWQRFTIGSTRTDRLCAGLALLAMIVCGVFFGELSALRYLSYHAEAFDMGIEDQMMWSTLHGKLFGVTLERRLTTSYLGYHFEPISLIGPVLYLVDASPISLVVFKNVVVALGAIPAYWLARKHLGSAYAGLVFALVYLLFPGLEAAQLYDWHAYTLTAPFLLAGFCFLEARRYGWLVVFLVLAAATKENSPLDAVPLGAYLVGVQRRFRLGSALALGGVAWFAFATYLVIPHFNSEGQAWLWTRYGGMGGSPVGAIEHFIADPQALLTPVPSDPNWRYVLVLLAPVAWLTLLSPTALFLMLPALAVNLLTAYEPMHLIETYHYSAHLVPFVVLGAVYGIGNVARTIARLTSRRGPTATKRGELTRETVHTESADGGTSPGRWVEHGIIVGLCSVVLAATFVYHHYRGYTPLSGEFVGYRVTAHDRLGDQVIRQVKRMAPLDAPISVQSNLYPHLSHRPNIWMFPEVDTAQLIVLDVSTLPNTTGLNEGIHQQVRRVLDSGQFGPVLADDGYLVLRRGAPRAPLPAGFYSFARAIAPHSQFPLDVSFGSTLELLGFDLIPGRDGTINLRAYWRANAPLKRDLFLPFYITDGRGHEKGATLHREPANVWYPTNRWQPGEIVQITTYNLPIGRRGKNFGIALGAEPGSDPFATAGRLRPVVHSAPWPMRTPGQGMLLEVITFRNDHDLLTPVVPPLVPAAQPAHPLRVQFAQGIELGGYSLTERAGRSLDLTLFWTASGATAIPYTVFAHVLSPSGRLIAQHDAPPDGGLKSTTAWLKGETVVDHLNIPLSSGVGLARASLEIGLYDPVSGRRLPATVDGETVDHIRLPIQGTR